MKKLILPVMLLCLLTTAVPAHAFLDYLFGGSQGRDAIDNSAVGDLRAWWTGNPAYQFNPYYSPQQQNPTQSQAAQGGQQMGAAPQAQPNVSYYPPQGAQQPYYGQTPVDPQGMAPQYQGAPQQYQAAPQGYQQAPAQQYQQAMPQQYQAAPQSYLPPGQPPAQYPAQAYQQQAPQQYQSAPQGYPAGAQPPASPTY